MTKQHHRVIFISDTHLGSRTASADVLLDFLRHNHCDKLVIVGDFIDFWALDRNMYFPDSHREVLRIIIKWSARNTEIVYVPGNHDDAVRAFLPIVLDNIKVMRDTVHETADGRKFLVVHGDEYDQVIRYAKWVAWLGDIGYQGLIYANHYVNFVRRHFGYGHWSLSAWVKQKVKTAVKIISDYETAITKAVLENGYTGVVCGHIHHAELRMMNGVIYANCGDWVESWTALVEDTTGKLSLIHWYIGKGDINDNVIQIAA